MNRLKRVMSLKGLFYPINNLFKNNFNNIVIKIILGDYDIFYIIYYLK